MGERVRVGDVLVRTYDRDDGLTFYRGEYAQPPFGDRSGVKTKEQLTDKIHQVVLHTDLASDAIGCFNALVGRTLSTHFIVDFNGDLYQPLDVFHSAYHAGDANQGSIGIDLNNKMANLEREPDAPPYPPEHTRFAEMSLPTNQRPKSDVKTINSARVRSYGYSDPQYLTLIELLKALTLRFPKVAVAYPTDSKGDVVANTLVDPESFSGFMAHWHWEMQRWDPGPGFDWERVLGALSNEHNSFPLLLDPKKNIGNVLDQGKVMDLAELYYANNQTQTTGWFPMGVNQTWHGGIHLTAPAGTPIRAITDGVLVAARAGCAGGPFGDNDFVLLRHEIPMGVPKKGVAQKTFVFFSLYMHLAPLDLKRLDESAPSWLRDLYGSTPPGELGDATCADHPWLGLGDELPALLRGDIAKIPWRENPTYVGSGAVLGTIGQFGMTRDALDPTVHVEVFAEPGWKDVVDMAANSRWLVELDDDLGHDLFVEDPSILALFGQPQGSVVARGGRPVLPPSVIEEFWRDTSDHKLEQGWLRKVVARHVSEWSDQVDWVLALSQAETWDDKIRDFKAIMQGSVLGQEIIRSALPYIWLSKEVAAHIGLDTKDWRGIVDHFHPIYFLMWLTYKAGQRTVTTSQGRSDREIRRYALSAEGRRDAALGGEPFETSVTAILEAEPSDTNDTLDHWLEERGPGEWQR